MSSIPVDPTTLQKLRLVATTVEIVDENGTVIGHFVPISCSPREPRIGEEEIQRRLRNGDGRPLADILRELEKRA